MCEFSPLEGVTEEQFHKHFDVNILGALLTTKEAVKRMGPQGGSIINISSGAGSTRLPNSVVYSPTKAAVDAITGGLAKELGPRKIRVNVSPRDDRQRGSACRGALSVPNFKKWSRRRHHSDEWDSPTTSRRRPCICRRRDSKYMTGETLLVSGGLR